MKKLLSIFSLAFVISGCAATSGYYGNHLGQQDAVHETYLANEAVAQLEKVYAPAQTRFEMTHPTLDVFGISLVKGLRQQGFAVLEKEKTPTGVTVDPNSNVKRSPVTIVHTLSYVLDSTLADDLHLYHMTLVINDQALTRPYTYQNGKVVPAGYWLRKE